MKPTVFYVEKVALPAVHDHIIQHLPRMPYWYEWQGCQFVYIPLHQLQSTAEWNFVQDYLTSQFPILHREEFSQVLSTLQEPAFLVVNRINEMLKEDPAQAFLLYTDANQPQDNPYQILSKHTPDVDEVSSFFLSGFMQLWQFQNPAPPVFTEQTSLDDDENSDSISFCLKDAHFSHDSKPFSNNFSFLADEQAVELNSIETKEIAELSAEVQARLRQLSEVRDRTAILDLVVYLLNNLNPNLRADQASVLHMLEQHWDTHVIEQQPSRLRIDRHYRIFLTDYDNREIKMGRLPKLLFLFYLHHSEGVAFRHLKRHRSELITIYNKLTNRTDREEIESSIDRLIDVHQNNSINEKCSRIREAFEKEISSSAAAPYLIQGPKGGVKQITLDRNLVDFD